jgi:hypothetical protein
MLVELLVGNARFYCCIKIADADLQDPVHLREIDTHPAPERHDIAFQAGASAKRDNRYLVPRTELDDLAHLLDRLREGDSVRRHTGVIGRILAVLLAHRRSALQAIA